MADEMTVDSIPAECVEFRNAVKEVFTLTSHPTSDEKLILYGLFKQGVIGDINTEKPGMFDMKGRYKWDAWSKNKGMNKAEAQTKYIEHVKFLKSKYA